MTITQNKLIPLHEWHPKNVSFIPNAAIDALLEYILRKRDEARPQRNLRADQPLLIEIPYIGEIGTSSANYEALRFLIFLRKEKVIDDRTPVGARIDGRCSPELRQCCRDEKDDR